MWKKYNILIFFSYIQRCVYLSLTLCLSWLLPPSEIANFLTLNRILWLTWQADDDAHAIVAMTGLRRPWRWWLLGLLDFSTSSFIRLQSSQTFNFCTFYFVLIRIWKVTNQIHRTKSGKFENFKERTSAPKMEHIPIRLCYASYASWLKLVIIRIRVLY